MKNSRVSRYHPLLVSLHWLLALLIIGMLCVGFWLAATDNANPQKIAVLRIHMATGMFVLLLMVIRFIVRLRTDRPLDASIGVALLDRLAVLTHYSFYVLVVLMVASGYTTGILARLNEIVFQNSGAPLPEHFGIYPSFVAHGYLAILFALLILGHIGAALYHQFIRKDGLLSRMGFGKRV